MKSILMGTITATLFAAAPSAVQAQNQQVYMTTSIAMETALKLAHQSLTHCRQFGFSPVVTVVDPNGAVKVQLVDDGAFAHAKESSLRKARTSASRRMATEDIAEENRHERSLPDMFNAIGLTTMSGGLPIYWNNQVIGAIGIAGAPGEEPKTQLDYDIICAKSALKALNLSSKSLVDKS